MKYNILKYFFTFDSPFSMSFIFVSCWSEHFFLCIMSPISCWTWRFLWTQTLTSGWCVGWGEILQRGEETLKVSSNSTTSLSNQRLSSTLNQPCASLILWCHVVRAYTYTHLYTATENADSTAFCMEFGNVFLNFTAVKLNKLQYVFRLPWFQIDIINMVFVFVILLGGGNMVAIDLIVQHVHSQLEEVRKLTLKDIHTHSTLTHIKYYFYYGPSFNQPSVN